MTTDTDILVGYGHAAILDTLRPDITHPARKVRRARSIITTVFADPCKCADEHVEIWVRRVD